MKLQSSYYYYIIVLAIYLGFLSIKVGAINDLLFLPLFILSVKPVLRVYNTSSKLVKNYMLIWAGFIIYNIVIYLLVKPLPGTSKYAVFRPLYTYFFFYITIAFVNSAVALKTLVKSILYLTVVAYALSVAQSMHGVTPLFDPEGYYNIGHWAGQGDVKIGPLTRVMLPGLYLIYIVFIFILIYSFFVTSYKHIVFAISLILPIFIGFSRSHWAGIVITLLLTLVIFTSAKVYKPTRLIRNIAITVMVFFFSFTAISYFNNKISDNVIDRVFSAFSDVSDKSGTYGIRLDNTSIFLFKWYTKGFYTGVDPLYSDREMAPELSDVGYVYVLVTIGLIGLLLYALIWVVSIRYGYRLIKTGRQLNSLSYIIAGGCLIAGVLFFILSQQYTQYKFTSTLFTTICGLSVSFDRIMLQYRTNTEVDIAESNRIT